MLHLDKSKFLKNVTGGEQHIVEAGDVNLKKLVEDVRKEVLASIGTSIKAEVKAEVDAYVKSSTFYGTLEPFVKNTILAETKTPFQDAKKAVEKVENDLKIFANTTSNQIANFRTDFSKDFIKFSDVVNKAINDIKTEVGTYTVQLNLHSTAISNLETVTNQQSSVISTNILPNLKLLNDNLNLLNSQFMGLLTDFKTYERDTNSELLVIKKTAHTLRTDFDNYEALVDQRCAGYDSRISDIESKIGGLSQGVSELSSRVDDFNVQLTSIISLIEENKLEIQEVSTKLNENVTILTDKISELDREFNEVSTNLKADELDIEKLKLLAQDASRLLTEFGQRITTCDQNIVTLHTDLGKVIESLDTVVNESIPELVPNYLASYYFEMFKGTFTPLDQEPVNRQYDIFPVTFSNFSGGIFKNVFAELFQNDLTESLLMFYDFGDYGVFKEQHTAGASFLYSYELDDGMPDVFDVDSIGPEALYLRLVSLKKDGDGNIYFDDDWVFSSSYFYLKILHDSFDKKDDFDDYQIIFDIIDNQEQTAATLYFGFIYEIDFKIDSAALKIDNCKKNGTPSFVSGTGRLHKGSKYRLAVRYKNYTLEHNPTFVKNDTWRDTANISFNFGNAISLLGHKKLFSPISDATIIKKPKKNVNKRKQNKNKRGV